MASISAAARLALELQVELLDQTGAGPVTLGVDGDLLVLARPFVAGPTLQERLAASPLSAREAIAVAVGALSALEQAHARGLVHGDVKPSNVVLAGGAPGAPVLVDHGLARHMFLGAAGALEDVPVDSIIHLAPEQSGLLERGVDTRADLYAVGLLLFEAVSGRALLAGRTVSEVLRAQLNVAPPQLAGLIANVPRALDRIAARLLRVNARDRYQTARGARADLEELAASMDRGEADPDLVVGSRDARDALTEPAFTGRGDELAALEHALAAAREGRGGLILLEGESGGGKTWLLEEFARRAGGAGRAGRTGEPPVWILRGHGAAQVAQRPFQVLSGVAREIADAAPAGSPRRDRLLEGAGQVGRTIAESLPALGAVFGAAGAASPEPVAEEHTTAALSELLDALGGPGETAMLLLDDGQWADAPTLRLLERWHDRPAASRHALVVLALRAEDDDGALAERRWRPLARVELGRFGPREVREQIASMAGQLPEAAVDLVLEHAAGNPFLVSALLRGLVDSGALAHRAGAWELTERGLAEPRDSTWLAELAAAWSARLPDPARRLLAVGAVLGRRFDPVLAGQLAGIDPGEAVRAAHELRGVLLWIDRTGASCAFPHDRMREALLAAGAGGGAQAAAPRGGAAAGGAPGRRARLRSRLPLRRRRRAGAGAAARGPRGRAGPGAARHGAGRALLPGRGARPYRGKRSTHPPPRVARPG